MKVKEKTMLLEPVVINGLSLKNRTVMAPMTRSRAIGNVPNDLMATYYSQRTAAGFIVTEGTSPSANGIGYARTPGIFTQQQIEGWKKVTKAVHQNDGKIFIQLMHVGRIGHPANMISGAELIAPSAIAAKGDMWTDSLGMQPNAQPKEMSTEQVKKTIKEFVEASVNSIEAGFDGIELHGANGYLIEQFLNPNSNQRKDEYGGSIQNRSRFLLETVKEVAKAIGKEKVGIRLSPFGTFNDMENYPDIIETYEYITKELDKLGILYIHVIEIAALQAKGGSELLATMRNNFKNIFILAGNYDYKKAEESLEKGKADLISFARFYISNPDLPTRFKLDAALAPADPNTFYSADEKGYTDYEFYKA
jgi:N-ethylmaleimide reductase